MHDITQQLVVIASLAVTCFATGLLAMSGWQKLQPGNREYFQRVIADYQVLSTTPNTPWANAIIVGLGSVELAIAIAALLPPSHATGMQLAAAVMIVYGGLMAFNLYRGRSHIECGCAGPNQTTTLSAAMLYRNALLACAFIGAAPVNLVVSAAQAALAVGLLAILAILYAAFEQLQQNAPKLHNIKQLRRLQR